ncbi:hypothetical protein OG21DRAFT_1425240 [Imleria badia]|nr:hypothetical protein OG21DRAFT_1425240 [Imleria badia]
MSLIKDSCEFRSRRDHAHFILYDLQEYDINYLQALLEDNKTIIAQHETAAMQQGYGPLVSCTYVACSSQHTQHCSFWHCGLDGILAPGKLARLSVKCPTEYLIYTPHDLLACPSIVVISTKLHSHPPPAPVKTPASLEAVLIDLLHGMAWRLADATPRRIMLDSGFRTGLQNHLGCGSENFDLSDLHSSLANLDHVRYIVGKYYYSAVQLLVNNDLTVPTCYVRCAEIHHLSNGANFYLVICMSPQMSNHLMHATRISLDTSFKCVAQWQEFEIQSWDNYHKRSVVSARAFFNCQSAEAHFILFRHIFEIAVQDSNQPVAFHYMHGHDIESVVADAHQGQGIGLGMFCQYLCRGNTLPCQYQPSQRLCDLQPIDHLKRIYRLCTVHCSRNLTQLRHKVSQNAWTAMHNLSSFEPIELARTCQIIRSEGKKANTWLDNKILGNKFALAGLYFPESLMPAEFWKACSRTSNGNEQAHRSINRNGTGHTLLAGVMHGQEYDERAFRSIAIHNSYGINTQYQASTHHFRASRSVSRHGRLAIGTI